MYKEILVMAGFALLLVACGEQQRGTSVNVQKETAKDFTTYPRPKQAKQPPAPMLPGKALLPAAPIHGESTQESSAIVQPVAKPKTP